MSTLEEEALKLKLSPQQLDFCTKYMENGCNASKAYIDSGYKIKSEAASRSGASRLLTNANVSAYIDLLKKYAVKNSKKTIDDLIAKNTEIAFSDINDVVEVREGRLVLKEGVQDLNQFDGLSATYSISSAESEKTDSKGGSGSSRSESETKSFSVKRTDRNKALDSLAKLLGAYDRDDKDSNRDLAGTAARILGAIAKVRPK